MTPTQYTALDQIEKIANAGKDAKTDRIAIMNIARTAMQTTPNQNRAIYRAIDVLDAIISNLDAGRFAVMILDDGTPRDVSNENARTLATLKTELENAVKG